MNNLQLFGKTYRVRLFLFTIALVLTNNICIAQKIFDVEGSLFGQPIKAQVDHKLAVKMLTDRQDSSVVNLFSNYQNAELNDELLKNITNQYSLDVSTLFLIESLYKQERNKLLQDFYLSSVDSILSSDIGPDFSFLEDFFVLFVPAFNYESNAGNFWEQRALLDAAKISHDIVKTQQWGLVEENAELIVDKLQEISQHHHNIIVVSVSKGGLEAGLALEKLTNSDALSSVKAWINVSGILKGSPAADHWLKPGKKIWLRLGLFFSGKWKVPLNQLLNDLSYTKRKQNTQEMSIPESIYTINVLAGKLKTHKNRSDIILPSDGYSPLLDEIVKGGDVVFEMAADHTFKDVDLNSRMITLFRYTVDQLLTKDASHQ